MSTGTSVAHSTSQRTWSSFSGAFDRHIDALEACISDRSFELASYDEISDDQLRTQVSRGLGGLASVLADRRMLSKDELRLYWSVTKGQADFGVTMQDTLTAWHIGLDVLCQWARDEVTLEHHPREILVDFLDLSVAWWRQGSDTALDYYRQAANQLVTPRQIAVDGLFWDIASGRTSVRDLEEKFVALGLDPAGSYYALRAKATSAGAVDLFRAWTGIDTDPGIGATAVVGGHVWGLARELPPTEFPVAVGIGPSATCAGLSRAFQVAGRALNTALSLGLVGSHGLDSLGVQSAVLLDHSLGSALVSRYVDPVLALGSIAQDVISTVHAYIGNHGNVDEAAAELFVHPNTVRYRVRRFEKVIDASLRDTSTYMSVWWALERYQLESRSSGNVVHDLRRHG